MKNLKFAYEFYKRKFSGATTKDAYMKAMKWYASNVIAKGKMHDVQIEIKKLENEPSVILTLYAVLDEGKCREDFCKTCRELNELFYVQKKRECPGCSIKMYTDRLDEKMAIKIGLYKDIARDQGGWKK